MNQDLCLMGITSVGEVGP